MQLITHMTPRVSLTLVLSLGTLFLVAQSEFTGDFQSSRSSLDYSGTVKSASSSAEDDIPIFTPFEATGGADAGAGDGRSSVDEVMPWEAHVNFQDEATVPPTGYVADFGRPFDAVTNTLTVNGTAYGFGWKRMSDDTPLDLSVASAPAGRNRREAVYDGLSDQEKLEATLMHFQGDNVRNNAGNLSWGNQNRSQEAYWEIVVPNGTYEVTLALGDFGASSSIDSRHSATLEGITVIPAFVPGPREIRTETMVVEVTDGALTMNGFGGYNTKITSIDIVETDQTASSATLAFTPPSVEESLGEGMTTTYTSVLNGTGAGPVGLTINDNINRVNRTLTGENDWMSLPTAALGTLNFTVDATNLAVGDLRDDQVIATAKGYFPAVLDLSLTVTSPSVTTPFRMNVAGPEYDLNGDVFAAETTEFLVNAGNTSTSQATYDPNPGNTGLYLPRRFGDDFGYAIPIEDGDYEVVLHMVENFFTGGGSRVFDVLLEGVLVLDDKDLAADEGKGVLFLLREEVTVTDGILDIQWLASENNGIVQAVEVLPIIPNTPPVIADQSFDVDENTTGLVGTVIANDVDTDDVLSFTITAGNDANSFSLDETTGELTLDVAQDHETSPQLILTVEVSDGTATTSATVTVNIIDAGAPPNVLPTAFFTADPLTGDAPLTISFDASGSTDSDGTITAYNWSFGDGETGSGETPSHDFLTAGEYTVSLTVTDEDGATSAEVTETITVTEAPPADFSYIEDFDTYGTGNLSEIAGGAWSPEDGQDALIPVIATGLTLGTSHQLDLSFRSTTHDYETLIANPADLAANQPFYFAT
ncbi:MAG: PKD domain-containing protein, partial [Bacteroidota bacterium]